VSSQQDTHTYQPSTGKGQLLGIIFQELQKGQNKNLIHTFEELFFANMPRAVAIKYVGTKNLKPKKIEVFKNQKWIQVD
jgi:hypothetical protein